MPILENARTLTEENIPQKASPPRGSQDHHLGAIPPSQKNDSALQIVWVGCVGLVICNWTLEFYISLFPRNIIAEALSSFCFLLFSFFPFVPSWRHAVAWNPGHL